MTRPDPGMVETHERRLPTADEVRGILPKLPKRWFKVLVTGSRRWTDYEAIETHIAAVEAEHPLLIVIQGGATGADRQAEAACRMLGIHCAEVGAMWKRHGPSAGPARNRAMLDLEPDLVLAFPLPDSKGTWDCVREAKRRGIEVVIHGR